MVPVEDCEPYFDYMRKSVDVNPDTMELVAGHLYKASFPAKHFLLKEGDLCNKVYFVLSGTARSYYTDIDNVGNRAIL